jgi:hypothetical protein
MLAREPLDARLSHYDLEVGVLRSIRNRAAASVILTIMILPHSSRSVCAQTPTPSSEPQSDARPMSLLRAAEAAVDSVTTASLFQQSAARTSADAAWAPVRSLTPGAKVEVQLLDGRRVRGTVTGVTSDALAVRTSSGAVSITRAEIGKIRVPDTKRRVLYGVIGIGAGAAVGWLVCPQCVNGNEGEPEPRYVALGAAAGAAAFLISPSRTVYQAP